MSQSYASVWWNVREKLSTQDKKNQLDLLFLKHIVQLSGSMTFSQALSAAKTIDTSDFAGQFGPLLDSEFSKK